VNLADEGVNLDSRLAFVAALMASKDAASAEPVSAMVTGMATNIVMGVDVIVQVILARQCITADRALEVGLLGAPLLACSQDGNRGNSVPCIGSRGCCLRLVAIIACSSDGDLGAGSEIGNLRFGKGRCR